MAIQKQLKFVKETNGDVILYTLSGQLIASFNEAQTILREAGDLNRFRIVTEINDPGFLFDYRFIDSLSCFPMIIENGINEFLIELSKKFFSGAKAQSGNLNLPIAFLELRLKSKGSNLCIPNKGSGIEIGDLVEGFKDANIYWESAMYKGGYKEDRNNYTPVLEHKMDYYCGTAPVVPPVVEPVVPPVVEPVVPPVVEPVVPPVVEPVVEPVVPPVVPPVVEPVVPPVVAPSIVFSNGSGFSASPFGGVEDVTNVSGQITVIGGTFKIRSSASIYTNNSTTVSCSLVVSGYGAYLYSERSNATGTHLSSDFIDLPPGVYPYTFNVRGSGLGGSGSGGVSTILI